MRDDKNCYSQKAGCILYSNIFQVFINWILMIAVSLIILFAYLIFSQFWALNGGISSGLFAMEYPLVILFCSILYCNYKPRQRLSSQTITPVIAVLGLYALYDVAFMHLDRSPRFSDLKNVFSLFHFSPFTFSLLCLWLIIIFTPTVLSLYSYTKNSTLNNIISSTIIKLSITTATIISLTSYSTYQYQKNRMKFNISSHPESVRINGRFSSFLYMNNEKTENFNFFKKIKYENLYNYFYQGTPSTLQNIHIIVLEGFIDPQKIIGIKFNRIPFDESIRTYLVKGLFFSDVISPVYGGDTAQAEFELLTGIPALSLLGSIEFNLFSGSKTSSFITKLKENGYYSTATIATRPVFFNSKNAYKGIGFDKVNFIESESFLNTTKDSDHKFDGDVLNDNFTDIEKIIGQNKEKPIVNYVLGMYGHMPFNRDLSLRPDIIETNKHEEVISRVTNQFFYRTQAISTFISKIKKIDPDSIILVISDHLPPIFNKNISYKKDKKSNIAILLNREQVIDISGTKYYEIPHLLWDIITHDNITIDTSDIFKKLPIKQAYFSYIKEATGDINNEKPTLKSNDDRAYRRE